MIKIDKYAMLTKLFGNHLSFLEKASKQEELAGSEEIETRQAIFVDELDTITGVAPGLPLEKRIHHLYGGKKALAPTIAYSFQNLTILQGQAYAGFSKKLLRIQDRHFFYHSSDPIHLEEESLLCSTRASTNAYGHLIKDQFPREMIAENLGFVPVAITSKTPFQHEGQLRNMVDLHLRKGEIFFLQNCWWVDNLPKGTYLQMYLQALRSLSILKGDTSAGPEYVYLKRSVSGRSNKRVIYNEVEADNMFRRLGFTIIDMERAGIMEI
jgi:hypothetical protein